MFNIALYQPDIPQNTAAIIRLCSCFDAILEIIEPCGFNLQDKRLKIPLKRGARSLNISIAAAITLAEALRQNSNL